MVSTPNREGMDKRGLKGGNLRGPKFLSSYPQVYQSHEHVAYSRKNVSESEAPPGG